MTLQTYVLYTSNFELDKPSFEDGIIVVLKLATYNRHPSSKALPSWLLTSQAMQNSFLNVYGSIFTYQ